MKNSFFLKVAVVMIILYSCSKDFTIPHIYSPPLPEVKGQWRKILDTFNIEMIAQVFFSIDNKGYSINQQTNEVYEYDATLNKVTKKKNFQGARRESQATAFAIGNKGYYGLGLGSKIIKQGSESGLTPDYRTDFWEYDPAKDEWTQKKSLPIKPGITGIASFYGAYGFAIGDSGYVGSGRDLNGSVLNRFFAYDQKSDTWKEKDSTVSIPYPPGYSNITMSFSIGDKGYVGDTSKFWEYYPKLANPWKTLKLDNLPAAMRNPILSISSKNRGYLFGSTKNLTLIKPELIKEFWEFNPQTGAWSGLAPYGGSPRGACSGFSLNDKIYIGFGSNLAASVLDDMWEYSPR